METRRRRSLDGNVQILSLVVAVSGSRHGRLTGWLPRGRSLDFPTRETLLSDPLWMQPPPEADASSSFLPAAAANFPPSAGRACLRPIDSPLSDLTDL